MFFDNPDLRIEILSVLHLNWEQSHAYAAPREFNALSFRVRGGAIFSHGGAERHVNAGEIAFVPKGFDYRIDAGCEEVYVVHFGLPGGEQYDMEVLKPLDTAYCERKFRTLYSAWTKKQPGYRYECAAEFYKLLHRLFCQKSEQRFDPFAGKMEEVTEYIHEHYTDKDLAVGTLAKMANMSDTYFRKNFVRAFGTTPLLYINDLKVAHAIELLRSGYYSVEETAEICGFDNQKYFSAVIKKKTGHTPSEFKK